MRLSVIRTKAKSAIILLNVAGKLNQFSVMIVNPLNAELNPIRHLLALAGAHHFVHVSRIRVNNGSEFESDVCPMRTTYLTILLGFDAVSLVL
jgi:hypothetical protein